jgi:phage I-like protein
MSADGKAELWALSDWGDQARGQIRAKEYRWTSVAIWPNAKNKVTGLEMGPVLTSVALTNKPFVEGMAPLTARVEVWGKAESAEELVVGLRDVLELPPEADSATVSAGLDELVAMYRDARTVPGYPEGVGCLLNQVRRLLGLRALAMADEILAAAGQALGVASASKPSTPVTPAPPPEGTAMSDKLRQSLITLYDVRDNDEAILAAATKSAGALATLDALMAQFKVKSPADLATAATAAQAEAGKVAQFATKLTEALAALEAQDEGEAKEEVDQIAASQGIAADGKGAGLRRILLSQRIEAGRAALGLGRDEKGQNVLLTADPSKLEAFRKEFPMPTEPDKQRVLLKTPLLATSGAQLGGPHTALPGGSSAETPAAGVPDHIAALSSYVGDNNVQRAIALLTDKQPGFKDLDWGKKNFLAGRYLETGKAA